MQLLKTIQNDRKRAKIWNWVNCVMTFTFFNRKVMDYENVYLTIDDGPSKDRKEKVDILISIWNSTNLVLYRLWNWEKAWGCNLFYPKGRIIGNHSYSHPRFSQISLEECFEEIEKTDRIIDSIYREAGVARPIKAFRFPYGDKGEDNNFFKKPYSEEGKKKISKIMTFLKELGYTKPKFDGITYEYYSKFGLKDDIDWYWTYDVAEWCTFQENLCSAFEQ